MLGKLIKHEFKATYKLFLAMYCGVVLLSVINGGLSQLHLSGTAAQILRIPRTLFMLGYILTVFALVLLTLFIMIQRFYKNLTGDEGYLMHTLPVRTGQLIFSKLVVAWTWIVATAVVIGASIFLLVGMMLRFSDVLHGIGMVFQEVQKVLGVHLVPVLLLLVVFALVTVAYSCLTFYLAISIGQQFPKHKLLASFLSYMGVNLVIQIASSIFSLINLLPQVSYLQPNEFPPIGFFYSVFSVESLIMAAVAVGCFLITNYMFKNRLNLE